MITVTYNGKSVQVTPEDGDSVFNIAHKAKQAGLKLPTVGAGLLQAWKNGIVVNWNMYFPGDFQDEEAFELTDNVL